MLKTNHDKIKASATSKELISITLKSRRMIEVATSKELTIQKGEVATIQWSRHQLQGKKVTTLFSGRDINYKERRSRRHLAVATSDPRGVKGKSRPDKSFCYRRTKKRSREV